MSEATIVKQAKPVGEILVERGLITREQINEALGVQQRSESRKLLGEVLVDLGLCSAAQIAEALADSNNCPFARISPELIDPSISGILPRDFIESNAVLPLFKVDGALTVAVTEPSNVFLIEEVAQLAGCSVQIVVAHQDPGVDNWIDTAGHSRGTMCLRWVRAESHTEPETRVVKLADL